MTTRIATTAIRRRRPFAWLALSVVGVAMLVASMFAQARLVWNFTPSIPVGLYALEDRKWVRGDRVALKPSGRLLEILQSAGVLKADRLLMKRVAAIAGEEVCRHAESITINGVAVVRASADPDLPRWSGCIRLLTGEVFLLGETGDSFDGRYFGVSSAADIVGPIRSVITF